MNGFDTKDFETGTKQGGSLYDKETGNKRAKIELMKKNYSKYTAFPVIQLNPAYSLIARTKQTQAKRWEQNKLRLHYAFLNLSSF